MTQPTGPLEPATPPKPQPSRLQGLRRSLTFRAIVVAILILLLLIPLSMVRDLIRERAERKFEAETSISADWGGQQTITGPVLSVPYEVLVRVPVNNGYEMRPETRYAHFLPEALDVATQLDPFTKYRGIYQVAVYRSTTGLSGSFPALAMQRVHTEGQLQWDRAQLVLGISDLRSIKEQVSMQIGGRTVQFEPGMPSTDIVGSGLSAPFPLDSAQLAAPLTFSSTLTINGSGGFRITPVGKVTRAQCVSTWKDPSYDGAFLPDPPDSTATKGEGFTANWTVLHLNRPYPQEFLGDQRLAIEESAFGVRLMQPVDEYHKNERASKYGLMLIVLVFLVFFFVEVLQELRIHPIQYLLVGFALSLFYTLLIAFSEHIGFAKAYILSAVAVIGLVVAYSHSVFKVQRASQLLGLIMLLVFGFMFALIHQQDYALLFGSIGLFITLALVMWVSRRIDWNGRE
ncbi:MAG: cell envelope integrity protein CreD [Flavobacteriales bacterium]|nr:cell envelope integrity protein CreD [Flavobacteriales bacterium]